MKNQIFILILCIFGIFSYNSEKAISYAITYCDKRNPDFSDYSNILVIVPFLYLYV